MKLDIEIYFPVPSGKFEEIAGLLGRGFSTSTMPHGGKSIRTDKSEVEGKLISVAVREFLEDFSSLQDRLKFENPILRVGIFFQVDEIAFLSIVLPESELELLDRFKLGLDISAYPCSSDDEEDEVHDV